MKTVDFKHFKLYKSIDHSESVELDARKEFADTLYKNSNGIVAHDLAFRIYKSDDPVELTDDEYTLCVDIASAGRPIFYDSFIDNVIDTEQA